MKITKSKLSLITLSIITAILLTMCACSGNENTEVINKVSHPEGYHLVQSTILGRHHVRSPLTDPDSTLGKITPNEWYKWSSDSGDLSILGGNKTAMIAQYFRVLYEKENLIPKNWEPKGDEVYFYANSQQRAIATSNFFATGVLPVADHKINHTLEIGNDDPVFWRSITKYSQEFKNQVKHEIDQNCGEGGLDGLLKKLETNFKVLEKALDFKDSQYAKENNIESLPLDDMEVIFEGGKDPQMKGSLKIGNTASDAFKLMYYEGGYDFGHNLSSKEWEQIAELGDWYQKILFGSYTAAIDKANPMLKEILSYIKNDNRKLTYMGGHDDNIMSVLTALKVEDYQLPYALNKRSPIGANLEFQEWKNDNGEEFVKINLVYETAKQLRNFDVITIDNPPMTYELQFQGLNKNKDGFYKLSDIETRFNEAISEYDKWQ